MGRFGWILLAVSTAALGAGAVISSHTPARAPTPPMPPAPPEEYRAEPSKTRDELLREEKLEVPFERLKSLRSAKRKPEPGEWLAEHPEPGQSVADYLSSEPSGV